MSEMIHPNTEQLTLQKKKKRRKVLRTILRTSLILLLVAALLLAGLFIYRKTDTSKTVTYRPYTASQGTISNALSFSGSLQLIDNVIYTADAASEVRTVYVAAGDQVTAGQKLIRLSNGQTIEAEFSGRVNQLLVGVGDKVAVGDQLVQVADFSRMKVSIRVDEYDISDIHVGQTARVTVTATEQTIETEIDSINYISASTGNVAYYTATAYVDVPAGVYPGMQATISIPQSEAQNVVVLNLDAISFDETNQAYVLMQISNGTMRKVSITTGVSNGNYVEITSGLQNGDVVYMETKAEEANGGMFDGLFNFGGGQNMMPNQTRTMPGGMQFPGGDGTQRNFTRQNNGGGQGGGR
ncbi:MAG: HlyD family efflux transporter periplasmic adaptor subunit [Clostridiales bacterium]|nr:HlyD family efflux transporter periplasmic adaptor subunit [Clostridiales bacterium]